MMAQERLQEIKEDRLKKREALIQAGQNPYPAEVRRTHHLKDLAINFSQLAEEGEPLVVIGRVMALRKHGALTFADLQEGDTTFQFQFSEQEMPADIFARLDFVDIGDYLQLSGKLVTTQRGVKTLLVLEFHIITKAILPLPSSWYGLKDQEARFRQRDIDLMLNKDSRQVVLMRHRLLTWLRQYLAEDGYLEVETPILETQAGGAAAKPFSTKHNALGIDLHLRIAAELHLKRLLVAGFEKVYELGPRFRNEGIDRQHNPEFTMLESQWAYADYEDLMDFTETVLEKLCQDLLGSTELTWQGEKLSFAKPLPRKRYVELVSERLGVDILVEKNLSTYKAIFDQEGLELPASENYYQLVDELYKELIRPTLRDPIMIYDYPAEMAPLAKRSATDPRVAEKFQTVVAGLELNNCYTELNDPVLQRELLKQQAQQKAAGDEEAQTVAEEYLRALEYGLPPNAGWSLGIDRLLMLLTDLPSLREVITFPLMKPK